MTPFPKLPSQQTLRQTEPEDSTLFPLQVQLHPTLQDNDDDVIIDPVGDEEDLERPLAVKEGLDFLFILALLLLSIKTMKFRRESLYPSGHRRSQYE
jgi:hypothetical protein